MLCTSLDKIPAAPTNKTGWPWTEESPQLPETMLDGSSWPRVSIVTPSYNQGRFIEETIRSVLLQGYPNLEYIIIDGGSTDNSVEVIQKYAQWLAYWVSEPDRGQAEAINKGFSHSTGQFLGWINSDDYFYPSFIHRMVLAFQTKPEVDFLYSDVDEVWDTGGQKKRRYGESLPFSEMLRTLRVPIPQMGSMWRRSVIEKIGGLVPKWRVVLDREFFLRVGLNCKMEYLPGAVAFFRYHSLSKSISEKHQWLFEIPLMYQEFFERKDLPKGLLNLKNETMSSAYIYCAQISFRSGEYVKCFKNILEAIKEYPLIFFSKNDLYSAIGRKLHIFRKLKT